MRWIEIIYEAKEDNIFVELKYDHARLTQPKEMLVYMKLGR